MSEAPFKIAVPDEKLEFLKKKLEMSAFPDELDGAQWKYGVPLADLRRLVARWKDGFDWRKEEAKLNEEMPQFTRDIEVEGFGKLNIHYVHQKSDVVDAIPLLFVHGWPGSFLEARKILPLLTHPSGDEPSFHVVAISLPGYGFSEGSKKQGFTGPQYAEVGNKLMLSLGYNEYVTQGGDWGYMVIRAIATVYPKHNKAWHTNALVSTPPKLLANPIVYLQHLITPYTAKEKAGLAAREHFVKHETGYQAEHATKPQTLGYSLADSPVGLLAWIYEKLHTWTDEYDWDDDEVLTWISLYWFSRDGPAASLRIYYEAQQSRYHVPRPEVPRIPCGVSYFPKEIHYVPKSWLVNLGNVVSIGEHERGGHFAAYEQPEALAGDVRKMFGKKGPAFGVVSGKSGYA